VIAVIFVAMLAATLVAVLAVMLAVFAVMCAAVMFAAVMFAAVKFVVIFALMFADILARIVVGISFKNIDNLLKTHLLNNNVSSKGCSNSQDNLPSFVAKIARPLWDYKHLFVWIDRSLPAFRQLSLCLEGLPT
jgi:hypothetical protein